VGAKLRHFFARYMALHKVARQVVMSVERLASVQWRDNVDALSAIVPLPNED